MVFEITASARTAFPSVDTLRLAPRRDAFRMHVRSGVPCALRPALWSMWLGVDGDSGRGLPSAPAGADPLIAADVPRTPVAVAGLSVEEARARLFRVLHAACQRAPWSYCQGMNRLAALLLGVFHDECVAVDALVRLVRRVGLFSDGMTALLQELGFLRGIVEAIWPAVAERVRAPDCPVDLVVTSWLLPCFVGTLVDRQCLRLWDVMLFEEWCTGGGRAVLTAASLALISRAVPEIMCTSSPLEAATALACEGERLAAEDDGAVVDAMYGEVEHVGSLLSLVSSADALSALSLGALPSRWLPGGAGVPYLFLREDHFKA